jgi:hypothetical protein
MSAASTARLQIPRDWLKAMPYLADLRDRLPLSLDEWHQVGDWLSSSTFDDESGLAGEVAIVLIRDHAPADVREHLFRRLDSCALPSRLKSLLSQLH